MNYLRRFAISRSLRLFSTSLRDCQKISILGAAGRVGQPLALLMKQSLFVSEIALYDVSNVAGIAVDLGHIETPAKIKGYTGPENLKLALEGAKLVLIVAGISRNPGMTRDDLFSNNASIVADLARACGRYSPEAMICLITNPLNSTVPLAAEILKKDGVYNPRKLFGVTTLDVVRANTFIAAAKDLDVVKVSCPVICGHSGKTIIPIFSQCAPSVTFPHKVCEELVTRIQNAGTEVVNTKAGAGAATLSMAYATARFANSLLHAMKGHADIVECTFVESDVAETGFFASPVLLGPNGVERVFGPGKLNDYEIDMLKSAMPELRKNILRGKKFAASY